MPNWTRAINILFALLGFVLSKLNYRLKYEFVEREGGGREDASHTPSQVHSSSLGLNKQLQIVYKNSSLQRRLKLAGFISADLVPK